MRGREPARIPERRKQADQQIEKLKIIIEETIYLRVERRRRKGFWILVDRLRQLGKTMKRFQIVSLIQLYSVKRVSKELLEKRVCSPGVTGSSHCCK